MAYGLCCAKCGLQETQHDSGLEEGEDGNKCVPGYRYSFNRCSGFSYRRKDHEVAVEEFMRDPIESFPEYLRRRAEKRRELETVFLPINHSVWLILPNGQVVDIGS